MVPPISAPSFTSTDSGSSRVAVFNGPPASEGRGVESVEDLSALTAPTRPLLVSREASLSHEGGLRRQGEKPLTRENDLALEARVESSRDPVINLGEESFSIALDSIRGDLEKPSGKPAVKVDEAKDPQAEIDEEEERLTQYYRQVLNTLITSKLVTEEVASIAQGKRGRDLGAAVGVVMSTASSRALQSSTPS